MAQPVGWHPARLQNSINYHFLELMFWFSGFPWLSGLSIKAENSKVLIAKLFKDWGEMEKGKYLRLKSTEKSLKSERRHRVALLQRCWLFVCCTQCNQVFDVKIFMRGAVEKQIATRFLVQPGAHQPTLYLHSPAFRILGQHFTAENQLWPVLRVSNRRWWWVWLARLLFYESCKFSPIPLYRFQRKCSCISSESET